MAKRPRVDLNQVLHYLSDDECAAEGSDDDSGMDEDPSDFILAQMKVFSLVPRPLPRFQCYTQKRGRAWYTSARD